MWLETPTSPLTFDLALFCRSSAMSLSVPKSHSLQIILSSMRTLRMAKSRCSSCNNETDCLRLSVAPHCCLILRTKEDWLSYARTKRHYLLLEDQEAISITRGPRDSLLLGVNIETLLQWWTKGFVMLRTKRYMPCRRQIWRFFIICDCNLFNIIYVPLSQTYL